METTNIIKPDTDPGINPVNKIIQNGQAEKTAAQKCMDEITEVLNKYNCEPLCVPQRSFGQQIFVWAVNEIKK